MERLVKWIRWESCFSYCNDTPNGVVDDTPTVRIISADKSEAEVMALLAAIPPAPCIACGRPCEFAEKWIRSDMSMYSRRLAGLPDVSYHEK
jgi:hypothetical protein